MIFVESIHTCSKCKVNIGSVTSVTSSKRDRNDARIVMQINFTDSSDPNFA